MQPSRPTLLATNFSTFRLGPFPIYQGCRTSAREAGKRRLQSDIEEVKRRLHQCQDLKPMVGSTVALFLPRVAPHVVAILLPESWRVVIEKLQPTHPFHRFPRVQVRNDKTQWKTVVAGKRLAVVMCGQ